LQGIQFVFNFGELRIVAPVAVRLSHHDSSNADAEGGVGGLRDSAERRVVGREVVELVVAQGFEKMSKTLVVNRAVTNLGERALVLRTPADEVGAPVVVEAKHVGGGTFVDDVANFEVPGEIGKSLQQSVEIDAGLYLGDGKRTDQHRDAETQRF